MTVRSPKVKKASSRSARRRRLRSGCARPAKGRSRTPVRSPDRSKSCSPLDARGRLRASCYRARPRHRSRSPPRRRKNPARHRSRSPPCRRKNPARHRSRSPPRRIKLLTSHKKRHAKMVARQAAKHRVRHGWWEIPRSKTFADVLFLRPSPPGLPGGRSPSITPPPSDAPPATHAFFAAEERRRALEGFGENDGATFHRLPWPPHPRPARPLRLEWLETPVMDWSQS